ncbi:MAG: ABC transporter permease, partial [Burkholderiales bacterium]|nr:ABC transporter permease [Burkholderiales bacterium]
MSDWNLSLKFTLRDWRAGELRLLIAALVVAVAAIASVGFFVDRMRSALAQQATQLIGADLVFASDQQPDTALADEARRRGLQIGSTVNFPSMVLSGGLPQLASIKAVSGNYPLRGRVRVTDAANMPDVPAERAPARGELWLDPALAQALQVTPGAEVMLGDARLRVTKLITLEPDRGTNFINFAPRAMMAIDDLAATGLIQPASRVTWRLLLAGTPAAVAA